jgi:hypothetical protein
MNMPRTKISKKEVKEEHQAHLLHQIILQLHWNPHHFFNLWHLFDPLHDVVKFCELELFLCSTICLVLFLSYLVP